MDTNRDHDDLRDVDEQTVEALLSGRYRGRRRDLRALAACLSVTRDELHRLPAPVPDEEIAQIIHTGRPRRARLAARRAHARRALRRRGVLTGTSTVLTTLAGKVLFGAVAVAAGFGGAHATGVVEIPGLPERSVVDEQPDSDIGPRDGETGTSRGGLYRVTVEFSPAPTPEPTVEEPADEKPPETSGSDPGDETDTAAGETDEAVEETEKKRKRWHSRWRWSKDADDRDDRYGRLGGRR